ncbi:PASTA domain-containing protein [Kribbella sp. NPDC003505]|uniref:PASTA domain-containing protein n=1 Tax=Kribbella sp. NPDC003505 TaxID=3154448 RepID=UPI0033B7A2F3
MTDLTDLLERTAAHTPVGPPPLDALRAGATRRRRRRTAGITGAAAVAVAAVVGGTTLLTSPERTAPVTSPAPAVPTRLVGQGHAAIAVPQSWGTNQSMCGTPRRDTVLIADPTELQYCMAFPVAGVDSVRVATTPRTQFRADETLTIDGVRAERQRTTCSQDNYRHVLTCSATVWIPSLQVWFEAQSSTSAAEVDRILSRIVIVPDRVGVPSYSSMAMPLSGAKYAAVLRGLGLKVSYRSMANPNYPRGSVLGVSPAVGTMVANASTVTVTVVK